MRRIFKKSAALLMAAAVAATAASVPAMAENETETKSITATDMRYIKGWDGEAYTTYDDSTPGLDIADKQGNENNSVYIEDTTDTENGHDINVGFVTFAIPENIDPKTAVLKLTATHGQYTATTTAYAAIADLSKTVATGQSAANSIDSITWANRPQLKKASKGVEYTTGASDSNYTAVTGKELSIPLVDENDQAIISGGENVTLAVYFCGSSARASFNSAVIEYTEKALEPLNTDTAIWADEILERGTAVRGTSANEDKDNIGTINSDITDEQLGIFKLFLDNEATAGATAIGEKTRLNALDNTSNTNYKGYIEDTISASESGSYYIYIMGTTANTTRNFAVTVNNDESVTTTAQTNLTSGTSAHLYTAQITLNEGTNTIHIQAPSGESAPNFIAMYITKAETAAPEKAMTQASFSGTFGGSEITNGTTQLSVGDEKITAWKGELSGISGTTKAVTVTAEKDSKTQEETFNCNITGGNAVFYVLINIVPDSMTFTVE